MRVRQAAEIVARGSAVSLKQTLREGRAERRVPASRDRHLCQSPSVILRSAVTENKDPDLYVRTTTSPTSRVR